VGPGEKVGSNPNIDGAGGVHKGTSGGNLQRRDGITVLRGENETYETWRAQGDSPPNNHGGNGENRKKQELTDKGW